MAPLEIVRIDGWGGGPGDICLTVDGDLYRNIYEQTAANPAQPRVQRPEPSNISIDALARIMSSARRDPPPGPGYGIEPAVERALSDWLEASRSW